MLHSTDVAQRCHRLQHFESFQQNQNQILVALLQIPLQVVFLLFKFLASEFWILNIRLVLWWHLHYLLLDQMSPRYQFQSQTSRRFHHTNQHLHGVLQQLFDTRQISLTF